MGRIDRQRRQHGEDAGSEQPLHVALLGVAEILEAHPLDTPGGEPGEDLFDENPVLLGHELVGPAVDGGELLGRGHTVRTEILRRHAGVDLLLQPGYPDLEELIEVRAEDRDELEPLEQPVGRVRRLLEHSGVEFQPRQLAVEVMVRRIGRRDAVRHAVSSGPWGATTAALVRRGRRARTARPSASRPPARSLDRGWRRRGSAPIRPPPGSGGP